MGRGFITPLPVLLPARRTIYPLGCWAKGDSVPLTSGTGRKFGIVLRFINNDVIVGEETASFNPDCSSQNDWQYLSMRVASKTAYTSLRIILVYECNANVVYFDGVQLFTASGQRISKTVNGTTYNYHYLGDQLVEMAWGANRMHFTYDAVGPLSVNFNGTEYFYLKNAQGDVTGLVDSTGAKVVAYTYGPWGEARGVSGTLSSTLGAMNPLRYRGYVYDTETGLYYVSSRYYDPEIGRFINIDGVMGVNADMSTYNLFAYCGNNPINRYDAGGMFWKEIISGILHSVNNSAVAIGIDTAAIGGALLNMDIDGDGNYHARFNCWQQYMGYNDLYDFFFNLGTSCDAKKFEFTYNGEEYVIWVWKGDYINMGAGAEMGIYTGGEPHWRVDKSLAMYMSMQLECNGTTIIKPYRAYTWWITGFNPNYPNVDVSTLTASFSIWFKDPGMYYAFCSVGYEGWSFGIMQGFYTARYTF